MKSVTVMLLCYLFDTIIHQYGNSHLLWLETAAFQHDSAAARIGHTLSAYQVNRFLVITSML